MSYNPGISNRADIHIAQGGKMWADIVQGIIGKQVDEDKARAREFKALSEYAEVGLGVPKEKTLTMGLDQLRGMVQGETWKRGEEQRQAQLKYQKTITEQIANAAEANKSLPDFMRVFGEAQAPTSSRGDQEAFWQSTSSEMPVMPRTGPPGMNAMQAFAAASKAAPNALGSPNLDNNMMALARFAGAGQDGQPWAMDPSKIVDLSKFGGPKGSLVVPVSKSSAQVVQDPVTSAEAREGAKKKNVVRIEVPDESNPVFGPKRTIELDMETVAKDYPHLLKPLQAGADSTGAGAGGGLPLPKSAKDLKTGEVYQTSLGLATWNGKKFVPVPKK